MRTKSQGRRTSSDRVIDSASASSFSLSPTLIKEGGVMAGVCVANSGKSSIVRERRRASPGASSR